MSSLLIQLADAIAAHITAGTYSEPHTEIEAVRRLTPVFEPRELVALTISVVPRGIDTTLLDRTTADHELLVDVAVQKKVSEPEVEVAALMLLMEEIAERLRKATLEEYPAARWMAGTIAPAYAYEHLRDLRVFTGVLSLTYRVLRR